MELEEATKIVEGMKNKLIADSSIWKDGTCSQAIDTVLNELNNRIPPYIIKEKIKKLEEDKAIILGYIMPNSLGKHSNNLQQTLRTMIDLIDNDIKLLNELLNKEM